MSSLSSRELRTVLGGTLAIAMLLTVSRGLPAALDWRRAALNASTSLVRQAADAEQSVDNLKATRDSVVARLARLASVDSAFVDGESPPLAAAAFAEYVADVAEVSSAQLGSVQAGADTAGRGPFVTVTVRTSASGDLASIVRLITGLESGPVLVAIRELAVTQQQSTPAPNAAEVLRAELVIEGLAKNRRYTAQGASR